VVGPASNLSSLPVFPSVMLDSLDRPRVSVVVCASAVASSDNTLDAALPFSDVVSCCSAP
jgi:hypothetical protein